MNTAPRLLVCLAVSCLVFVLPANATPQAVVTDYSTQVINILKGPIAKALSFIILMACAAALLRGRHRLAVSCGVAFIVLLFLQVI